MAGYWPRYSFRVYMDREGVEVNKHAKYNKANIQPFSPNKLGQNSALYYMASSVSGQDEPNRAV